jgi:type III pantothenate kinase
MEILAIDSGNTRIKWGFWDGAAWARIGALAHDESAGLAQAFAALPQPQRIAMANVAGVGAAGRIETACARFGLPLILAQPRAAQCGVTNRYDPAQLGADRWAALIGAWHRQRGACLVVGAGTATTADLLSARGEFLGGIIIPGLALMKRALAENTARLPFADGAYVEEPRNTADAIDTGVLHAQAGAIERMYARLVATEGAGPACLISGGAAPRIAERLGMPHRLMDHLVLDGLARIAMDGMDSMAGMESKAP